MTRLARAALALLALGAVSCGRESTPTGPSGPTSFLAGTWRGTVTIQVNPAAAEPTAAVKRRDDVDVRSRSADEHAVVPCDDSLDAPVADDGNDRCDGAVTRQLAADTDQHARRVQLAPRMPWHVRQRRRRTGHAY